MNTHEKSMDLGFGLYSGNGIGIELVRSKYNLFVWKVAGQSQGSGQDYDSTAHYYSYCAGSYASDSGCGYSSGNFQYEGYGMGTGAGSFCDTEKFTIKG